MQLLFETFRRYNKSYSNNFRKHSDYAGIYECYKSDICESCIFIA
jgi:hypothetical protein